MYISFSSEDDNKQLGVKTAKLPQFLQFIASTGDRMHQQQIATLWYKTNASLDIFV